MAELRTLVLVGGVLLLLGVATTVLHLLRNRDDSSLDTAVLRTFRMRVRAWWVLFAILALAFLIGGTATVVLFGLMGFWALREFITLTPTRPGDHRALFWVFFLFTPLQFVLVGMDLYETFGIDWYALYSIVIPIYGLLFVLARVALAGDYKRFLERVAKIQVGLLICVYCLSYVPALLTLDLPTEEQAAEAAAAPAPTGNAAGAESARNPEAPEPPDGTDAEAEDGDRPYWGANLALLFFFVLIVQLSDALQYAWAQIPSRHPIAPTINPNKTWEGLLGGTGSVALVGAALWWATPFSGEDWWMAAVMSMVIAVMGFGGSITMSAIKRDRGVKDYGTLVEGHGGILDRIDSLCFAAPVFFHLTSLWLEWQRSQ